MRAFVFGAGASYCYKQSPTGQRPPLAREFFSTFGNLEIATDFDVKIQWLLQYVRQTRGVAYEAFGRWNEDIEAFLTEIDQKINTPEKAKSLDFEQQLILDGAFKETVLLFASVLNEIQSGPISSEYAGLIAQIHEPDALITFNWDTLLDHALWKDGRWNVDDGYGIDFLAILDDEWRHPRLGGSKIKLLKLHGSTNWLMPYRFLNFETGERTFNFGSESDEKPTVFCYLHSSSEYVTYKDKWRGGYQPFSYWYYPPNVPVGDNRNANSAAHAMMPMIVPPVKHKEYDILSGVLSPIWGAAEESISNCDELLLIGYSFPVTDLRAIDLLRTALDSRETPLPIRIINPWPEEIEERLKALFGRRVAVTSETVSFDEWRFS